MRKWRDGVTASSERHEGTLARAGKSGRQTLSAAAFAIVVLAVVWAVQVVPEWQVRRANNKYGALRPGEAASQMASLQNDARKTIVQIIGGIFAIGALWLTYRRTKVTEQGHITDRYTKAIEQLGATKTVGDKTVPNVEVRLGAIYALERIAFDSPRDQWTIMEVLTAYVRENAPAPEAPPTEEENKAAIKKGPATEIQAILTVLGRRRRDGKREGESRNLDLTRTDLRGATFFNAHVEGTYFFGAHVEGAHFFGAHVEGAHFSTPHMEGAHFSGTHAAGANFVDAHVEGANFALAHLESASFYNAHLENADFAGAHVASANFFGAHVEGAYFSRAHVEGAYFGDAHVAGAYFLGAEGLTVEQITPAIGWKQADFDEDFRKLLDEAASHMNAAAGEPESAKLI